MNHPWVDWIFPGASFALLLMGFLLMFEVLRPFHDLKYDGPLAMGCWILGAVIAALGLWARKSFPVLNGIPLALNTLALLALSILHFLLNSSRKLF